MLMSQVVKQKVFGISNNINLMNDKSAKQILGLSDKQQTKNISRQKSLKSESDQQNKTIDIFRLLSKHQRSRLSKVSYPQYYNYKNKPKRKQQPQRHSDYPSNFRNQSFSVNDQEQKYSTYVNKEPVIIKNMGSLDQSFLSTNQSNSIIGILLYLIFVIFISLEVIVTAYIIPKKFSSNEFYYQTAIFTILLSEFLYYVVLRYLSHHTKKKLFLYNSARRSFDKLMKLSKTTKRQQRADYGSWLVSKPYFLLTSLVVIVIVCQLLYSKVAVQLNFIFDQTDQRYMVSMLFWSNFALPYLLNNFYLIRPREDRNTKFKIFSVLVTVYVVYSLAQGFILFLLIVFNLLQTYIHSKKQVDTFHVNQLIKAFMLICVSFYMAIKYCYADGNSLFNGYVLSFILTLLFHVIVLTASMLVTRILAIKYIKDELYRYYYTQTSINISFVVVTIILNLVYLSNYYRYQQTDIYFAAIANIVFLIGIGSVIYAQGRQRLLVTMDEKSLQDY